MTKEPRLLGNEQSVFSKGLRIVRSGIWWYYSAYAVIVGLYFFDVTLFMAQLMGETRTDTALLLSLGYLIIALAAPLLLFRKVFFKSQ